MLREDNIPVKNCFNFWFNREKRKEFYTTSISLYKTTFNHNKHNRFPNILFDNANNDKEIHFSSSTLLEPFEESYGTFLIKFLNANFASFESSYRSFFCFYGFSILSEFDKSIPLLKSFKTENEFIKTYQPIFNKIKPNLKKLQYLIKQCVDYMFNLNNNSVDRNYTPLEKCLSYSIFNNLFKYSTNIEVYYYQQFTHDIYHIASQSITPKIVREHLENGIITLGDSPVFHTLYLSNILYISLFEIATNKNVKIKICKNCGKYFIPLKNTEKYCDIVYCKDEVTCKKIGANNSYSKKRNTTEWIRIYRNNYQRRLMLVKRLNDEQVKIAFDNWKKLAKGKIKEFNNNEISEDELLEWIRENKDS